MNRLTIIVPTAGKRWELLRRCLTSIVTQTIVPKIICVHNHSAKVPDMPKGVEHIRCPGNIYKGFNAGILKSKTEWVLFIGDDDYLGDTQWVEKILKQIECSNESNYIYHLTIPYGSDAKAELLSYAGQESEITKIVLERRAGIIPHSGAVYKKALHDLVGMYPEHIESQGDTYWICKVAQSGYLKLKVYNGEGPIINKVNGNRVSRDLLKRRRAYEKMIELVPNYKPVSTKVLTQIKAIINRTDPTINKGVIKSLYLLAGELDKLG